MLFKKSIPLYVQIKELLINKINNKEWLPGDIILSETTIAKNLNVSLGTVRKAIMDLVDNNVLNRKQGKGTFVAIHDVHRALFHFFNIVNNNGNKNIPHSNIISFTKRNSKKIEAKNLNLKTNEKIICIKRTRELDGKIVILEQIILADKIFSLLTKKNKKELPNTLYELYESHFGITIHSAKEKISATTASLQEAKILNIKENHPLLRIERLAQTLDKKPIEFRITKCNTSNYFYENTVL